MIHPGMAKCSDLPALLRAAGLPGQPVTLLEYGGRAHTTNWCAPAGANEVVYTLDGSIGERLDTTELCTECSTSARPALQSIAREGGCKMALERLEEIGVGGALSHTAQIWELLDEHAGGTTPNTLRRADEALAALEVEWRTWRRGRLGTEEQAHVTAARSAYGPGIALLRGGTVREGEEYSLLAAPAEYDELIRRHTQSTHGQPLETSDDDTVLETALTLWHDSEEGGTRALGNALERARLIHQAPQSP